jgi:hypothetical protein
MIDNATKGKNGNPLKYDRRIIIVTDGRGSIDTDDLEEIALKIQSPDAPIEVVLLGVDFDDADSGYKEEDKSSQKVQTHQFSIELSLKYPRRRTKKRLKLLSMLATGSSVHSPRLLTSFRSRA